MENNIIKFKCPHCQQPLALRKPETGLGAAITCPRCGKAVRVKITEKPIHLPGQGREQARIARLILVEGPQPDRAAYTLKPGENIIGREDPDTRQDVAIRGDMTISRRSASLEVTAAGADYTYRLRVLNAKNPVYVNGAALRTGDGTNLRPGDTIQLGLTKLVLK